MSWAVEYDPDALKAMKKLDRKAQADIYNYMENRIATAKSPRDFGKALRGSKHGLWRYRLRDYRIICQIQDHRLVVLVVTIGHRSTIYE